MGLFSSIFGGGKEQKKKRVLAVIQRHAQRALRGEQVGLEMFQDLGEIGKRTELEPILHELDGELSTNLRFVAQRACVQTVLERIDWLGD